MEGTVTWQVVILICGAISATAWLTWFMSAQFRENRTMFYRIMSAHNREDDDRFEAISTDIWRIHLRNASKDGMMPPERERFTRRHYLEEMSDGDGG